MWTKYGWFVTPMVAVGVHPVMHTGTMVDQSLVTAMGADIAGMATMVVIAAGNSE